MRREDAGSVVKHSAMKFYSEWEYALDQAGSIESQRQILDQCSKKACMSDNHLIYTVNVSPG